MDEQIEPKKRRGRPPMNKEDRKGGNLTFRVRDGMREWLETSAKARGLSISEEVEKRLEQSRHQAADPYMDTALRMAAANCDVIRQLLGKGIAEDPFARAACAKAAATAVELVGGLAGQDTPEARAFLQADQQTYAETLGEVVAMLTKALLDGAPKDATDGLGQIIEAVAERRRIEIAESDRLHRQTLARLLRESAPAQVAPEPSDE